MAKTKLLMVLIMGHGWMVHYATPNPSGGRIAIVKNLTLFSSFEDIYSFLFDMPSGVGTDNELLVWSSGQPSINPHQVFKLNLKPALLDNPLYATPYKIIRLALTQLLSVSLGKVSVKLSGENLEHLKRMQN